MVFIDYCILSMEIMEIYHKCSSDNDSQIYMANALRFFLTIGLWEEYNNNLNVFRIQLKNSFPIFMN
jgi:hypothetical protein